jgi:hypothetical protein
MARRAERPLEQQVKNISRVSLGREGEDFISQTSEIILLANHLLRIIDARAKAKGGGA